ncbi:DUF4145 domain-containing protein [Bacillus gobiensis]|uniref:DUF4145 domain-containing protein n=1 Tax=Bacillus gobiensis TaxID=1441095 RepID=UPI003D1C8603
MTKTVAPKYYAKAFNCPRCGVLCTQNWFEVSGKEDKGNASARLINLDIDIDIIEEQRALARIKRSTSNINQVRVAKYTYDWKLELSICHHCKNYTLWENTKMIYPFETELPKAHEDMPGEVKGIYEEAALIYKHSPRASAALLRLAIEKMIPELEGYDIKKESLNNMIHQLVQKDIPDHIQQGLDAIRIYGNDGIHSGEIFMGDNQETVNYLFELVNYMTEELITKKKKIKSFYEKLPLSKIESILKRDKAKQTD